MNGQQLLVGGDVIVAMDGQPIATFKDLSAFMQQAEPGQDVALTLLRNGSQAKVDVTLGQRPALPQRRGIGLHDPATGTL